jgi:hypothetical protein
MYRAGSSRVTHPFAGLPIPEGMVLPRLACVRRAASVRPEPGSNSPLEIFNIGLESPQPADPWRVTVCSAVKGTVVLPGHGDSIRFENSWICLSAARNQLMITTLVSRLHLTSRSRRRSPKAGSCTGFWHSVQFSRSEMRSVRVPLPPALVALRSRLSDRGR